MTTKAQRTRTWSTTFSNKTSSLTERKTISFWNRERWPNVWRAGVDDLLGGWYRGAWVKGSASQSRWWKQRYNLGAISPKESEEIANRGVESAYEEPKLKCMAKRISFQWSTCRWDNFPSALWFCAVDQGGIYRRKRRDRWQRKCAGCSLLEAMQERVPLSRQLKRLSRRKHNFNGLDQKLYERWPRPSRNVKTSYVTVKTGVEWSGARKRTKTRCA